ncbi:MAG: DUF4097 family beta strand repeat-containing protein [Acidobacteriota bacterium]
MFSAGLLAAGIAAASPGSVREFHRTLPLSADGHLSISTYKGSITVTSWDRAEADVSARVEADGTEDDAEEKVARTEVRIDGGGSSVRVRSDYDKVRDHSFAGLFGFGFGFGFGLHKGTLPLVHYTIRMPATARLDIEDYKSRTSVAGLRADLKLHTYKGEVVVDNLDGAAHVETYKGDVRVSFARYAHPSRFETYKGTFEVRLPKDSRFELDADGGRRGEVDSDFQVATRSTSRRGGERARGSVNGGGPSLRFESSRGSLRLRGI